VSAANDSMQISSAEFGRCTVAGSLFAADCGVLVDTPGV